jgi:threonine/homoserine/homoserine lactone efflux protein
MRRGRAEGLRFAAGLAAGLAVWGVLAASGLGAVLAVSERALVALKLAGGCYLLWLAWKSGRAALRPAVPAGQGDEAGRPFARGLLLNLSNPKGVFAWLATLSLGLPPDAGWGAVWTATALCACIGYLVYLPWVLAFSTARAMRAYARARSWIDGAVAGLFAGAGVLLLRDALRRGTA